MSPTLALIVQREAEIDTFKPVPFYTVALELPGLTVSGERMADKAAAEQLNCLLYTSRGGGGDRRLSGAGGLP